MYGISFPNGIFAYSKPHKELTEISKFRSKEITPILIFFRNKFLCRCDRRCFGKRNTALVYKIIHIENKEEVWKLFTYIQDILKAKKIIIKGESE